ncbi:hypothetical protein LSH36_735g00018 [Paralvinella palmiformis]|uniref:L-Fucosyltransferase n=1 Tax=Paralvinella palmiformis TaxID=53620 RepID=A0AAD9MVP8_9ANNE|nr:hypothetical protein LSH36_735g00018 [Paralvinella palmiformis]
MNETSSEHPDSVGSSENKTTCGGRLMLSVLRQGRLGNAMWEYSALYGLANLTNRIPILNPGFRDLRRIFSLSGAEGIKVNHFEHFYHFEQHDWLAPYDIEVTSDNLRNISQDVMLKGYFQHFRFFAHVSDKIRKEFTFRREIKQKVSVFFEQHNLMDKNIIKIGIHIRRRDLSRASWIKKGFGPPDLTYFINAMNHFRSKYKRVHFIVCSDDLKWVRKHISGRDVTIVQRNAAEEDMALLSSCNHVIISNGTFSWWIGWLCRGTTVRYKGIPKPNTTLYYMTNGQYWPPDDAYNHYVSVDSQK